ncbi:transcription factor bHLH53-like [Diospyros lotus]|uniref:transcription factor bHLH53-like n=1 Tax=Diospyros lotus TaxID=55363 RepID=UPI00225268CA|nr:transcription factor bHLH53-like [Diospyros lotus]
MILLYLQRQVHCHSTKRRLRTVSQVPLFLMALSFYSNWGTLESLEPKPDCFPAEAQAELTMELLGFQDNNFLIQDNACLHQHDHHFQPPDLSISQNYSHLHPFISPPFEYNSNFLTSEPFPPPDFEPYLYPMRQKIYENHSYSDLEPRLFDGFVPNPPLLPVHHVPCLDFHSSSVLYNYSGSTESTAKEPINGGSLSAQSIAARQRRRKITEKTQQLGKLIPGANRMNTAEMFQAAFKYVKYMQAQIRILDQMASIQDDKEDQHSHNQELQALASSPCIQEKLYASEKCLVPCQFVQTLANGSEFQLNSLIVEELDQFILTSMAE